jgi:hypothetical protein
MLGNRGNATLRCTGELVTPSPNMAEESVQPAMRLITRKTACRPLLLDGGRSDSTGDSWLPWQRAEWPWRYASTRECRSLAPWRESAEKPQWDPKTAYHFIRLFNWIVKS